jgi:hypothetical protein
MKKIGHYLGNIAGAVLAFALYMLLEIAYFAPKRINLGKRRFTSVCYIFDDCGDLIRDLLFISSDS